MHVIDKVVGTSEAMVKAEQYYKNANDKAMEWTGQVAPLRLADMIDEIAAYVSEYVYFENPDIAPVIALWIVQTYCFEQFYYCGYIAIRSELPGSGKTVLLDLLGAMCKGNPAPTVAPTEAVLFRGGQRVWLIDEVDNLRDQDAEIYGRLIAVLNSGFKETGSVSRMVKGKDDYSEKSFSTYGPKAFAGLKKLAGTISDRCFHVRMEKSSTRLPRITVRWLRKVANRLRGEADTWTHANLVTMRALYEKISELNGVAWLQRYDARYQDITEPLVTLAVMADVEYGGSRISEALKRGLALLVGERKPEGDQLIRAICDLENPVLGNHESVFIPSQRLLEVVRSVGFWWLDSTKALAAMFKTLDLTSRSNGTVHGYSLTREWFESVKKSIRQGVNAAPAAGF